MKFIDVNAMVGDWVYHSLQFSRVEQLQAEMDRLGIEKAFVFDSRAWALDPKTGNDFLVLQTAGNDRMIPVMVLTNLIEHEFHGREWIINYMRKYRIGGVRLFPFDQNYTLNLWNIDKLFSFLDEMSIPVFLECDGLFGNLDSSVSQLHDILRTYPNTPVVLINPGYRRTRILYDWFAKFPNLYVETSTFIPFRGIEDVVAHFGSANLLYGSRMPFMEPGASLGRLLYAGIDEKDRENIAFRNALQLLKNNKLYALEAGVGE